MKDGDEIGASGLRRGDGAGEEFAEHESGDDAEGAAEYDEARGLQNDETEESTAALSEESRQSRSAIDLKRTLSPSAPEDSPVHSRTR
jgi:hypothetical protein